MRGVFITGTDTGVGKTILTAALARALKNRGMEVAVSKPFASASWQDSRFIKRAAFSTQALRNITPFYFKHPLAPLASLQLEKRTIHVETLPKRLGLSARKHAFWIMEGIGGAAVPITEDYDAMDIPKQMKLPVVIVARLSLGTLNHTALTANFIRSKGLRIKGIILNAYPGSRRGLAEKTNPKLISSMTGLPVLGIFPAVPKNRVKDFNYLAKLAEKHIELPKLLC